MAIRNTPVAQQNRNIKFPISNHAKAYCYEGLEGIELGALGGY